MDIVETVLRVVAAILGVVLVLYTIDSALRSFVLPRADRSRLTSIITVLIYRLMSLRFRPDTPFATKDKILAMHPPYTMFILPLIWLANLVIGYTGIYLALDPALSVRDAFILSGSSLMTLGAAFHDGLLIDILAFSQAALSMMLIALLIGFLPTMYGAFSDRELMVTKLEAFAGTPPSPTEMIRRLHFIEALNDPDTMITLWTDWQNWFLQIEEQHTTLSLLNFYRSPQSDRHWVTAAGCVLDTAALIASSVDVDRATRAGLVLRSGYLSLRTIADSFGLDYDPDPTHDDPIRISRAEFEHVLDELAKLDIPLHPDRDRCWDHYSGWRVNYDEVLIGLAAITKAPYAMWSSDRAREWLPEDIPSEAVSILEAVRQRGSSSEVADV